MESEPDYFLDLENGTTIPNTRKWKIRAAIAFLFCILLSCIAVILWIGLKYTA